MKKPRGALGRHVPAPSSAINARLWRSRSSRNAATSALRRLPRAATCAARSTAARSRSTMVGRDLVTERSIATTERSQRRSNVLRWPHTRGCAAGSRAGPGRSAADTCRRSRHSPRRGHGPRCGQRPGARRLAGFQGALDAGRSGRDASDRERVARGFSGPARASIRPGPTCGLLGSSDRRGSAAGQHLRAGTRARCSFGARASTPRASKRSHRRGCSPEPA